MERMLPETAPAGADQSRRATTMALTAEAVLTTSRVATKEATRNTAAVERDSSNCSLRLQ